MLKKAEAKDIPAMLKLVNSWAKKSRVLPVTKKELRKRLRLSWVWENRKKEVVGYVSLLIYRKELAEIRSMCVEKNYQRRGIGTKLLQRALLEAKKRRITTILTITKAPEFYKHQQFRSRLVGRRALLLDPEKLNMKKLKVKHAKRI